MKAEFRIPYPKTAAGKKAWNSLYGLNRFYAGVHWSKRKEAADYWHLLTVAAMNKADVRKKPFKHPVVISMWFNDRLDCTNHAMMVKFIEDGMKGRLIEDDSRPYVKGTEVYFHGEDYILVRVREINEGSKKA